MRASLLEDKADVRDPPGGLREQLGRVGAVAAPANDERRRRDLAEPFTDVEGVVGHDGHDHVEGIPIALDEQRTCELQEPPRARSVPLPALFEGNP